MKLQQFEQAVLKLAFETDARITTASVAYYLGVPSREANRLLNELLEEGVLELDSDQDGNLYYQLPNKSEGEVAISELKQLEQKARAEAKANAQASRPSPESSPEKRENKRTISERFLATPDDAGDTPAFSPAAQPSGTADGSPAGAAGGREPRLIAAQNEDASTASKKPAKDSWGGFDDYYEKPTGLDGNSGRDTVHHNGKNAQAVWTGVARRIANPDASVDRCGSSSMVVSTEVRCEPRPLPSPRPEIASCSESAGRETQLVRTEQEHEEQMWFGLRNDDSALVETSGETALARDYYIEQPEHQPGMALLLSLILCGTGQIYNGEVSKGIMMMVLCFLLWFVLLGWVVHIWSIVDAVVVAERLNRKQV